MRSAWRRATNHFETNWQSDDGLRLYAQGWEPDGDAQAVVCLVHGLGEHSGRYAHVAAALTGAGYALLAFDLRGHGRSLGVRGHSPSFEALMQDIDCLLDEANACYPRRPCFLYGHSLGGGLVLNYVLRRRPRLAGVIATGPALRPAFDPPGWKLAVGKLMCKVRPTFQMANGLDLAGLSHDPSVVRAYKNDRLVHDRVSARLGLDIIMTGEEALAMAGSFPLPLLLMHGNSDRITSCLASRQFAKRVPAGRCTFKEWDGLYHELHNEPEQRDVLRTMIEWLNTRMAARPALGAGSGYVAEDTNLGRD